MRAQRRKSPTPGEPKPRVFVIGGGLAGMTTAKAMSGRGFQVFILEKDARLGGKAGASQVNGSMEDHGFHVFPAWYANTRALLRDLGCDGNLADIHRFHFLRQGDFPRYISTYEPTSLRAWMHNLFSSLLPWDENVLSYFALLDLACAPFSQRSFLDRISGSGFLRSRFYMTDQIAAYHHQTVLQASAIPACEFSAMTFQKVIRAWMRNPSPLYSVLNRSLQDGFITPFAERLQAQGVTVLTGVGVEGFETQAGCISGMIAHDGAAMPLAGAGQGPTPADVFVLATPHQAAWEILGASPILLQEIMRAGQREAGQVASPDAADDFGLGGLVKLTSTPIASLHIHLKRRIRDIPPEHINLADSRFGITLIDIGQHWDGLEHTTLNLNVANYEPLRGVSPQQAVDLLVDELLAYFPTITRDDFAAVPYFQPHDGQPLFLNTIGAWHFRPETRTTVPNLYMAGDYCRTDVDFTTMESAVMSGLTAAGAILEDLGCEPVVAPQPLVPPLALLWTLRAVAFPMIVPLGMWKWVQRQLQELREQAS